MSDPKKDRKPDLSKYIDDNIRNFDLLTSRRRTSTDSKDHSGSVSTASSTHSSKMDISVVADSNPLVVEVSKKEEAQQPALTRSSRSRANAAAAAEPTSQPASHSAGAAKEEAVSGIRSKPKRVCFVPPPIESEVVAAASSSSTSTASVTKDVRVEAATTKPSTPNPTPRAQPQTTAGTDVSATTATAGILADAARYVELNGRRYIRLNVLGKGGSSSVFRIIDVMDGQVYAYKRVEVKDSDDADSVFDSYANEIALLRRLSNTAAAGASGGQEGAAVAPSSNQHSRIIQLVDYEVRRDHNYIAMVLEAGDIDLAKVLAQKNGIKNSSSSGAGTIDPAIMQQGSLLDPFFARMVWREMLEAVDHIHQHRIVHGDLKPANFVFVKGHLKLIDFGIAKSFSSDTTNIYRDSQVGTINYMAPEALNPMTDDGDSAPDAPRMRLGRASDVWSLGCILYQMVFGKPPFAHMLKPFQKIAAIANPNYVIEYPVWGELDAVDSMKSCLVHDARQRSKIQGAGGLLDKAYLKVPKPTTTPQSAESSKGALPKEHVHNIVGAVLDALSDAAHQNVERTLTQSRASGVSTRGRSSGRLTAEAQEAQKLAQGVVKWIDEVDQQVIEDEVMEIAEREGWDLVAAPEPSSAAAATVASAAAISVVPNATTTTVPQPVHPAPAAPQAVALQPSPAPPQPTTVHTLPAPSPVPAVSRKETPQAAKATPPLPSSAAVRSPGRTAVPASPAPLKRKVVETPGSVTRSAAKKARTPSKAVNKFEVFVDPTPAPPAAPVAPKPTAVQSTMAAESNSAASGMVRASTWAPVSISRPPATTSATTTTAASSSASAGGVKTFTAKPAFLSNILSANSKLTSFIGAGSSTTTSATFLPSSSTTSANTSGTSSSGATAGGTTSVRPSFTATTATSTTTASSSSSTSALPKRSPLKAMPLTLQEQIQLKAAQRLNSANAANPITGAVGESVKDRAAKWMKPPPAEEQNLHSSLERQLGALRKLMNWDEEPNDVTETVDASFGFF